MESTRTNRLRFHDGWALTSWLSHTCCPAGHVIIVRNSRRKGHGGQARAEAAVTGYHPYLYSRTLARWLIMVALYVLIFSLQISTTGHYKWTEIQNKYTDIYEFSFIITDLWFFTEKHQGRILERRGQKQFQYGAQIQVFVLRYCIVYTLHYNNGATSLIVCCNDVVFLFYRLEETDSNDALITDRRTWVTSPVFSANLDTFQLTFRAMIIVA